MNEANQSSNTQPEIEAISVEVLRLLHSGTDSSGASLQAYRQAGIGLLRLKDILLHGQFLKEVKLRFGISKQWAARLMQLALEWDDVERAVTRKRERGPLSLSVDGALTLVKKQRQAVTDDTANHMRASERRGSSGPRRMSQVEQELHRQLEATVAELTQANAQIRFLEAEVARLQAQIDPVTEAYAEETAMPSGRTLPDFLAECGAKSPVDWTNEDAPPDEAEEAA